MQIFVSRQCSTFVEGERSSTMLTASVHSEAFLKYYEECRNINIGNDSNNLILRECVQAWSRTKWLSMIFFLLKNDEFMYPYNEKYTCKMSLAMHVMQTYSDQTVK